VAYCDDRIVEMAAHPVSVIDPVGAGDAFAAGYLAERLRGRPVTARLAAATGAGAHAVSVAGDWEGLPSREDLARLHATDDQVVR
jgi:2-dehydro-3-deoxygluconokinase